MASTLHSVLSVWECGNGGRLNSHKNIPPAWCLLSRWGTPSSLQLREVYMIPRKCVGVITLSVQESPSSLLLHQFTLCNWGHWTFFFSCWDSVCIYITFWVHLTAISLKKRSTLPWSYDSWSVIKMLPFQNCEIPLLKTNVTCNECKAKITQPTAINV